MKEKETPKGIELIPNHGLGTPWVDVFNVSLREDGQVLVRFFTQLPEGVFEQSRIMTNKDQLKTLVDSICDGLGHYPVKKKEKKKKTPES